MEEFLLWSFSALPALLILWSTKTLFALGWKSDLTMFLSVMAWIFFIYFPLGIHLDLFIYQFSVWFSWKAQTWVIIWSSCSFCLCCLYGKAVLVCFGVKDKPYIVPVHKSMDSTFLIAVSLALLQPFFTSFIGRKEHTLLMTRAFTMYWHGGFY